MPPHAPGSPPANHKVPQASGPDDVSGPRRIAFRLDPGWPGVRVLAAVVVIVAVVAAAIAWWSRPVPAEVRTPASASIAATPAGSAGSGAGLVVAVAGKVRKPGLVRVPAGARIADVIEAAGGALPETDLSQLNLARKVTDGELVLIGLPAGSAAPGGPVPAGQPGKVNLNTATAAELDVLPGVGPVTAQRIIDHRTRIGGYRAVTDLRQVEGIGDSKYEQIKDLVTV